jgi:drug/metabolite transporter (DMT)-like permease
MILTRSKCVNEAPLTLALALNIALLLSGVVATGVLAMLNLALEQSAVYPFVLGSWTGMGLGDWAMVALLGALIAVYSACVAKAYQVASPSIVATFDYAYLVFAAVWGFVLFADTPTPGIVIGMILITVAGVLVTTHSGGAHEATSASVAERS